MKCEDCRGTGKDANDFAYIKHGGEVGRCKICNGTGETEPIKEVCEWSDAYGSGYLPVLAPSCSNEPCEIYKGYVEKFKVCPYCSKPIKIKE